MRKTATLLAAAALMAGTATTAYADPPEEGKVCSGAKVIAPDIIANTCMEYTSFGDTSVLAVVFVTNNSQYTLTGRADLLFFGTTIPGPTTSIPPHKANTGFTGVEITNPPGGPNDWLARGFVSTGSWSTYTFSR
ncbi:hypothetical protein [Kutzneria chonburiensis]|uniref:Secreted protein n=1 Tax=Kutzneria chonburiensis TaxID=1483604 RepID=A0ABV6N3X6_9PSEU|nr:hypothetical protein [Kutzneria chonburiensis]